MGGTPVMVLDVETVPDEEAWSRLGGRSEDAPLKPALQRVVAVAAAWLDGNGALRRLTALESPGSDEATLIRSTFRILESRPRLVGWNTRGFDLPVLVARAMLHQIRAPAYYAGPPFQSYRYRYADEIHTDLMDVLSQYGAAPRMRLAEMAAVLGIPAKVDGDGGDVVAWEAAGDRDRIRAYCETDVLATAVIWARYAWHRGWWGEDQCVTFAASVREFVSSAPGPHWDPWRTLDLRRVLPIGLGHAWEAGESEA
ncbi:3'-5' exonuclease [Candidatus Hydrogenisulfobacillus filiaventi]|uniref:3'-5' exonuclease n=1 Tax=Candidatus Hydrogenisulfobacillus filiaventi TaxID=2707344 RepID=A0A6F8ZI82_9FIRM|nr:3'-5' exonuclease [Candidatus Hydrogenisulfobacillus filiaventi]